MRSTRTGLTPYTLVALILASCLARAYADTPPASCPDQAHTAAYRVSDDAPATVASDDIGKIQKALLSHDSVEIRNAIPRAAADNQTVPGESFESIAINGLYQFLTERAQLELETYLMEELRKSLCGTYQPYFPQTCSALGRADSSATILETLTLQELRRPLEQDVRSLPACIIHNPKKPSEGSDVGYLLMDVFRQLTSGAQKSGNVFYGLGRNSLLYAECADPSKGNNMPTSRHCRMFEAMTAVASGIQVAAMKDLTVPKRANAFVSLYVYNLAFFTCSASNQSGLPFDSFDDVTARCNAYLKVRFPPPAGGGSYSVSVAPYLDVADKVFSAVAEMTSMVERIQQTADLLAKANGNSADDYRAQIASLIADLAQQMASAYSNGMCVVLDPSKTCEGQLPEVISVIQPIADGLAAYAQFAAGNYAAGVAAMPYLREQLKADYLVPAARLAQSKSSEEFSATLKSIASPAGAWRLKKAQTTWSVVSFVGFQAGSERLEGRTTRSTGTYYGAYIPLGIAWSQPFGSHKGYWGVDLSALDLGVLASNHPNRNAADAGTKTSISTVLSPGISIYTNPGWFGPVTFGVGYVYRTPGLRTVTGADGQQTKLDSSRIMLTVGVDVTVFKLNH